MTSAPVETIIDQVLAEVYGYSSTVDASSYLTSAVGPTDLVFYVSDASGFSRGLVEIGTELIMVDLVDRATGTLTCGHLSGRGVRGTDAASHSVGDRVVMSPTIPRIQAVNAVNQTISASAGLFAVDSQSYVYAYGQSGYALPATADTVLDVAWLPPSGVDTAWVRVRRWDHDKYNEQIIVGDTLMPGADFKVTYSVSPTIPLTSDLFSATGLPDSCIDVIRFGASWRLVSFLEPASLMAQSAEADAMKQVNPSGARLRVSQYFYSMYQQRLREEVSSLQGKYPVRTHFGG